MKQLTTGVLLFVALIAMTACSHRAPTISHVHIGHALTGWHDTPDKEGLFVVAEKKAGEALEFAHAAAVSSPDMNRIKTNITQVIILTDGEVAESGRIVQYGVKQALANAVSHITYAATSPDATDNTKAFSGGFAANAAGVLNRCDLITALGKNINRSESVEEATLLAPEIERLARENVYGEDLDGDGNVGSKADEYGLVQLRRDIEAMIAREDPPYTTVNSWYLFNLIRLPDGSWAFRKRHSDSSSERYGGGGGGGY